jgi:hypothetical protein
MVVAAIHSLPSPADDDFLSFFEGVVSPVLKGAGATLLASFVTEHSRTTSLV